MEKSCGELLRQKEGFRIIALLLLFFAFPVLILFHPAPVQADEGWGPGQDRFKILVGGYFPSIDTELRVDTPLDLNEKVDLEDSLGFNDDDALWRLDGYWRFFKRHRLGFGYYGFSRDASATLEEDIEFEDIIFKEGAKTDSELNLDFYTISYMYSFLQGEKWEAAGGLGIFWIDFDFSIAGSWQINDNEIQEAFETADFEGPLPFLGLKFDYYITPKWLAKAKAGYFAIEIEDIDGSLTNLGAGLEYQFTRTFGLGVGYDYFRTDVTADNSSERIDLVYKYHGVQVFGILRF